jgi:hypothetical protein
MLHRPLFAYLTPEATAIIKNAYLCRRIANHQYNRIMNNADFWAYVREIIAGGFTPDGLHKLDTYAEQFISGRLVYQRFSPREQRGCAAGGEANVIASLLAGAEDSADSDATQALSDIRINTPELRQGGTRRISNDVVFIP